MADIKWKDIPGYEGYYQVSTIGGVRSLTRTLNNKSGHWTVEGKVREPTIAKGRALTSLWKENKGTTWQVHRLVAITFLGPPNGLSVNHIDGDKLNNNVENLEFISLRDNSIHQHKNGLAVIPLGSHNGKSRLTEGNIPYIRVLRTTTRLTLNEIGARFGVSPGTISAVLQGRTWSHVK